MKKTTVLASLAGSLVIAGGASAAFTSWSSLTYLVDAAGNVVDSSDPTAAYSVLDVYAVFDAPTSVVNVFNANITFKTVSGAGVTFNHSDLAGGSWAPQFTQNAAIDTFLSLGMGTGFANPVQADPNFGPLGFNNGGQVIPALAGWFNANPPTNVGATSNVDGIGIGTFVGRFVVSALAATDDNILVNWSAQQTSGTAQNPDQTGGSAQFKFAKIPAPGALALLGLAGLAGSRRRRA